MVTSCLEELTECPLAVFALTRVDVLPDASIPMMSSISAMTRVGIGCRQINLVEHRQDLEALVDRRDAICDALRLHALSGVDNEQRALTGRQRS